MPDWALAVHDLPMHRITSYNVCYTKLLRNNQIYGLTKGQYSPTSKKGFISKTSPFGTIEGPFRPGELTIGARGQFFARTIDVDLETSREVFMAAANHKGTSIVEVLQNCVIFNDRTHEMITDKEHREDRTITLRDGEPMIFGKNRDKGLIMVGSQLKVVTIGQGGVKKEDIMVHNAGDHNTGLHIELANMEFPEFPVALGVIRSVDVPTYDQMFDIQLDAVQEKKPGKTFLDMVNEGHVWEVK